MSKLYLVGTPIGNLGDISSRALEVLGSVDFIAAEDTRVTRKLLTHFNIHKPLVSYYQHNLRERGEAIVARISAGESCAIVTDAGMPCISDPGEDLVTLCHQHGIPIEGVPGPSALVAALALSGLPTGRFTFEGFLSVKRSNRIKHLRQIQNDPRTLIFYEAPHKLVATLRDMSEILGKERPITLCRELTKLHEEILRTTLAQAIILYDTREPRGEYVLVVGGASPVIEKEPSIEEATTQVLHLVAEGSPLSQAAKEISAITGHKKTELYRRALAAKEN